MNSGGLFVPGELVLWTRKCRPGVQRVIASVSHRAGTMVVIRFKSSGVIHTRIVRPETLQRISDYESMGVDFEIPNLECNRCRMVDYHSRGRKTVGV